MRVTVFLCLLFAVSVLAQEAPKPPPPAQPQQPPPAQQTQEQGAKAQPAAKPPAQVQVGEATPEGKASIELFFWPMTAHPVLRPGAKAGTPAALTASSTTGTLPNSPPLDFNGKIKPAPGVVLSLPGGGLHNVRLSYFQTKGSGNATASGDSTYFGTSFSKGDLLVTRYSIRYFKISYDFLSYPDPPEDSKWRFKTLWEAQGVWFKSSIDAPLHLDSSGNSAPATAAGTNWFVYPAFGVGFEHFTTEHLRFEGNASGFVFPHRAVTWNAQAQLAYRVKHVELVAGVRGFHFKTSPKREEFVSVNMSGAYVGIQWYPWYPK